MAFAFSLVPNHPDVDDIMQEALAALWGKFDEYNAYMRTKDAEVRRTDATFTRPNGIIGTEDGKTLFITDAGASRTWRFELGEDGVPGKSILFSEIGGDGMPLD